MTWLFTLPESHACSWQANHRLTETEKNSHQGGWEGYSGAKGKGAHGRSAKSKFAKSANLRTYQIF
jgi:hypothetical protein